jgi:hypothetical protein
MLDNRSQWIDQTEITMIALWQLDTPTILEGLRNSMLRSKLLERIEDYPTMDSFAQSKQSALDIHHHEKYDEGNDDRAESMDSGLSSDDDDRLDADILTDLNTEMQRLSTRDIAPTIRLLHESAADANAISLKRPLSPRSQWCLRHPAPASLPPIATLFEASGDNHATGNATDISREFGVWTIAASAMATTEAIRVCGAG